MTTLIIPDIHNKWRRAQRIIEAYPADIYVLLGDIFDDYNDTPQIVKEVAIWYKDILHNPKTICLVGNHDAHYMWAHPGLRCSGYTHSKAAMINSILTKKDWDKAFPWVNIAGHTISHAGIAKQWDHEDVFHEIQEAYKQLQEYPFHRDAQVPKWFQAGYSRGGPQVLGGITWLDWNADFEDIPDLAQIVGHTSGLQPRRKGASLCLDTNLRHIAIIDGKTTNADCVAEVTVVELPREILFDK